MADDRSSHLVLARKWRPERFGELVGQEHVTRTLSAGAARAAASRMLFFSPGFAASAKPPPRASWRDASIASKGRRPSRAANARRVSRFAPGRALDVVEIDGATYRKIDDARAIIENLSYRPARDRFKIYIIDEAHQLTDQAFNALLKTLEEPPPHVKFILATTEPQKMPETILSRLQRYDFRRIPFAVIFARLKELASREGVDVEEAALRLLAREAGGSMRDAERMLETAIACARRQGDREPRSRRSLGVASRSRGVRAWPRRFSTRMRRRRWRTVRELHRRGANLESLGRDMLETAAQSRGRQAARRDDPQSPLADLPDQEAAELKRLAAAREQSRSDAPVSSDGRCAGADCSLALSRPAAGDGR